jgi:tetratricopeptide (TPR) repeat protein
MKKLVLASAMALASVALVASPALRAQASNSDQIMISNPAEFNAYQNAITQTSPAAKASALENFLTQYPNSVVKKAVLDQLMDTYQQLNQPDKALSAASRILQLDPNDMKAVFFSVYLKKNECQRNVDPATGDSKDPQTCNDAATLAQKGLGVAKPAGVSDDDWKKMTGAAYPLFHSAIALDDAIAKHDYAGAIKEYTTELMLYPENQTTSGQGLVDTLNLAEAYAKPGPARDEVKAIWFYARAWDFAPPAYKSQIEPKLDYWYKRYHGTIDTPDQITEQVSAIKTQAQATLFPPSNFSIAPAPTPAELAHHALTSGDPTKLNLEDKEYILANANEQDAQQLWSLLQGQLTPVPGIVISDPAGVLKVTVTTPRSVKPKDYVVKLNTPAACDAVPPPPKSALAVAEAKQYLQANGASADVSAIDDLDHARKIEIVPAVTAINMAVTQDAKDSKAADFNVNLKEPLACKDAPAPGFQLKTLPDEELDGTYDTYTKVPAANNMPAKAQIVLKEGFVQMPQKKAPVHRRPAGRPVHRPGA